MAISYNQRCNQDVLSIIQTFLSEHSCNHVSETRPEVCCAGDVTRGLDNGGEPGEDVAREVEAGVQAGPGISHIGL